MTIGKFKFNFDTGTLTIDGVEVFLTPKEEKILRRLVENLNELVSIRSFSEEKIDHYLINLRRVINTTDSPLIIDTSFSICGMIVLREKSKEIAHIQ